MKLLRLIAAATAAVCVFNSTAFAALKVGDVQIVESSSESSDLPFTDVDSSTDGYASIKVMYEKGYINGYNDSTFKPDNSITRAELTRMFNQVFGYSLNTAAAATMTDFTDNANSAAWYYNDVRIAQSNGYINGFNDGSFRPQENFTREQACTVIAKAANLEAKETAVEISDPVSEWAKEYVNTNLTNGVFELESGSVFRAKENITRAEVCKALAKFATGEIKVNAAVTETTTAASAEDSTEATTTDGTTETTTTKSSSSSSSSGGGGGGGSSSRTSITTTTEATTETTTFDQTNISDEQEDALARVISVTKDEFIPRLYKSEHLAIANLLLSALQTYYADRTYDYASDFKEAKQMYKAMSDSDQDEFRTTVISSYSMNDYQILMPLIEAFL